MAQEATPLLRPALAAYNRGMEPSLNERAWKLCDAMVADAGALGIAVRTLGCGTRIVDCGASAGGSTEAGRRLAEICLAGLGTVFINPAAPGSPTTHAVHVSTNTPVAACMASQYAGWEIKFDDYFAMGSGPMRAAAGHETLFETIGHRERPPVAVGVLESDKLPTEASCLEIARQCSVPADRLTLLVARTASPAGTAQVVARSVETALHKLHELDFDLNCINAGIGVAPLPPVAGDDLTAIGWTNDAILYGASVTLLVEADDAALEAVGPRVPSNASADYGRPFAEIFSRYDRDFYRIDPMLFSPAVVKFINQPSRRTHEFGQFAAHILAESFGNTQ